MFSLPWSSPAGLVGLCAYRWGSTWKVTINSGRGLGQGSLLGMDKASLHAVEYKAQVF